MARAIAAFGSHDVSGLVGKIEYKLSRNGQIITERSRARNPNTVAQMRSRQIFAAIPRAWASECGAMPGEWENAAPAGMSGYNYFAAAFQRGGMFYPDPLEDMVAYADLFFFPFWVHIEPADWHLLEPQPYKSQAGTFYVDLSRMSYADCVMSFSFASKLSYGALPNAGKFRHYVTYTADFADDIQLPIGQARSIWLRMEHLSMYDFRLLGTRTYHFENMELVDIT